MQQVGDGVPDEPVWDVLIVGAGPVGATLALDLAWRGIRSLVIEASEQDDAFHPRCNTVSPRSMEIFRRLGFSRQVRARGLPADHPNDVTYATHLLRGEMGRIPIPSSREQMFRWAANPGPEGPTPEPAHRISQLYLDPLLRERLALTPNVTVMYGAKLEGLRAGDGVNEAEVASSTGGRRTIRARFVVGCDGPRSATRRLIGVKLEGDDQLARYVSALARIPDLKARRKTAPAWMTWLFNAKRQGTAVAIDGEDLFLFHCTLRPEEAFETFDVANGVAELLGEETPFDIITTQEWTARRLVASKYRVGDVFLAGDAAHVWIPLAGFGMNAGIEDAAHLSWLLAAVLQGWGGEGLLSAYEAERRPVGDTVSRAVKRLHNEQQAVAIPADIEVESDEGERLRCRTGEALIAVDSAQFQPIGLAFGIAYADSPIIVSDGETAPQMEVGGYQPTTVPGCRMPNLRLQDGSWLYDWLGPDLALLVARAHSDPFPLVQAARARGLPLTVIDLSMEAAVAQIGPALILLRPDNRVAWRGAAAPEDPEAVLAKLVGAAGAAARLEPSPASVLEALGA